MPLPDEISSDAVRARQERAVAADPQTQADQQRRELAVASWLAGRGHPVVPPSQLVPAEPVARDGLSMTFWQHVQQVPDGPDDAQRARLAAQLHAAMYDYPGELRFLMPLDASVPDGLALAPAARPARRAGSCGGALAIAPTSWELSRVGSC